MLSTYELRTKYLSSEYVRDIVKHLTSSLEVSFPDNKITYSLTNEGEKLNIYFYTKYRQYYFIIDLLDFRQLSNISHLVEIITRDCSEILIKEETDDQL